MAQTPKGRELYRAYINQYMGPVPCTFFLGVVLGWVSIWLVEFSGVSLESMIDMGDPNSLHTKIGKKYHLRREVEVRGRFRMSWIGSRVNYSRGFVE